LSMWFKLVLNLIINLAKKLSAHFMNHVTSIGNVHTWILHINTQ